MSDVVLVDSGGANLSSLVYAFGRLGAVATVSREPAVIASAKRLVLPGVGAAADAMQRLTEAGLVRVLRERQGPLLGICLGMQLLYEHSEEGDTPCLARVPGSVRRLAASTELPVPHMGWSRLSRTTEDPLFAGVDDGAYVYFVHGFAAEPGPTTIATATHGVVFAAALRQGNLWGTQFHPERSGAVGARVLASFLEATSSCA